MLTIKQNLWETIRGGKPDRFVKQYEFMQFVFGNPFGKTNPGPQKGQTVKNAWGVTNTWPDYVPGSFPMHDPEHVVIKDITHWKEYVKAPNVIFPDVEWEEAQKNRDAVNTNEVFAALMVAPGLFEQSHHLQGIDVCLVNLFEEPDHMKDLIKLLVDFELRLAEQYCKYLKPEVIFHHDDWGSHRSSFMSPEMFDEFYLDGYKQIYGYYKQHGVQLIVHHSDSYAANLVPEMIEMGIDIFQGCSTTNNVPDLVKKFGGKISFMGDIDNGVLDKEGVTPEEIRADVERACRNNGVLYFIPCLTRGLSGSIYPGVYEAVDKEIDRMTSLMFK